MSKSGGVSDMDLLFKKPKEDSIFMDANYSECFLGRKYWLMDDILQGDSSQVSGKYLSKIISVLIFPPSKSVPVLHVKN